MRHESRGVHDVTAYGGMSSTSHPLATAAGTEMLMWGGNAVDAAIAAAFALAVCEPAMSHLGGQGNMLVRMAGEAETVAIDFYACAPGSATPDMFRWIDSPTQGGYRFRTEDDANTTGARSVCIPGSVCGWVTAHRRWGLLPLAKVVMPAQRYARDGVPLNARMAAFVREHAGRLANFDATARLFLRPDGRPREEGDVIVQPELADTLERIGRDGFEPLYHGDLADAIVSAVRGGGGVLERTDLERYPGELLWVRRPDSVSFRSHTVEGATPASSALLLHLLLLLDGAAFEPGDGLAPGNVHLLIECMKLAFADRGAYVGDHSQVDVPLEGLLNPAYAADRRRLVRTDMASFPGPGDPWAYQEAPRDPSRVQTGRVAEHTQEGCTTHHVHADRWGNLVSISQSLGDGFGSAMTVPGTGILLNNAMKLFDPRPGAGAAGIAPYRRPLAPFPTLVSRDGRAVLALGSPSGTRIPNAIAQVLLHVLVHGKGMQDAVEMPRVHWSGAELEVEGDVPDATLAALRRVGHAPQTRHARSPWFGAVQAIARIPDSGLLHGAADPRRFGAVAGVTFAPRTHDPPQASERSVHSRSGSRHHE